jgi:5-hydroxyisourate hydrolase-like protein (transthyretin family)
MVAGVVVNGSSEPVPNIRVTIGKLGVNLGPFTQFLIGDHPTRETTITADAFTAIAGEIEGAVAGGGLPPEEMRAMQAFKSVQVDDIQEITVTPTGSMSVVYKSAPSVTTDERGRFSFNVDPGTYRLTFSAAGYAKQDYGQRASSGGVPLTLAPGQAKTDIVMRMLPVGAVAGRIRDSSGQPVASVPVQIFRFAYDETGKRTSQRVAITRTNDLGEYRMYYLTPGRYYFSAGSPPSSNPNIPDYILLGGNTFNTQNRIQQLYAQTFYPGVAREGDATAIEVPPGEDLRGIDMVVTPQQTYKIRGRILDSRTGQPPQTVAISMMLQNPDPSGIISSGTGNPNYKVSDGSFELQNIAAGAYVLSASISRPGQNQLANTDNMSPAERNEYYRAQQAEDLLRPKASLPLTVVNSDLDGVVLSMGLNGTISGRIRVEGDGKPSLDFVRVLLRNNVPVSILEGGPNSRPVAEDGAFKVENVRPGEYRVSLGGVPAGYYLKTARMGDTDVFNAPLRFVSGEASGLELVISPNGGVLEGDTEPGAQVVLIPTRNRDRTELFRPVTADSAGHFKIPNVTPGDYTLAAWESIDPFSFFDPNLMRVAETQGKTVRVEEASEQTVNLTAIK